MTGYDFTPLPSKVERRDRGVTLAERLPGRIFGRIDLVVRALEPIHVGSGFKRLDEDHAVRGTARSAGTAIVPGSTLKGSLRARFEAMTKSCALWAPKRQRRITSRTYSGFDAELSHDAETEAVFRTCDAREQCAACSLFGYQSGRSGQRSRVGVGDVAFEDARVELLRMPEQYSPRLHHLGHFEVRGHTLVVTQLFGRKFTSGRSQAEVHQEQGVEAIPAQAEGTSTLRLFNVEPAELGGILTALGVGAGRWLHLGAGKSHGFGRTQIERVTYALVDRDRVRIEPDVDGWYRAFVESADYHASGAARLTALHGGAP